MIKKSIKIFVGSIVFLIILAFYLLSDFNPIYVNDEYVGLTNKLTDAKKEDLQAFVKIYQNIDTKMTEEKCPCDRATDYIGPYRHGYSPTKLLYKLKIQREFSQMDCFKYLLLNTDFKHAYADASRKTFGVKEASKFYFHKNIKELNETEVITLIAMLKNPSLYDPIRNKDGLNTRVKALEYLLKNKNLQIKP